ncbi:DUF6376 family protein [Thermoflavimicrobium daqui]|uniref:Lipoprotein n=1 Tax=Thermoflavimicrobium daqui TaxID=2137476 RepID=A0A364K9L2_9BACL|nr:DUF6376 family protein [Thermoflavimicrobium daqui]RAL26968.1 hypothetical protein DL897_02705 [Thermoflavimicrobium daqui]
MVKKWLLSLLTVFTLVVTGGCSLTGEVSVSVEYVSKTADYIKKVQDFYNEVPGMVEKAVTDSKVRKDLETKLNDLKTEIQNFEKLTPPDFAKDIHQTIQDHNQKLQTAIDGYLGLVKDGKLDPQEFKNSELYQTMNSIINLLDQVQNLGK